MENKLESFRENHVGETEYFKNFSRRIDYLMDFFQQFSELIFYNGRIITFHTDNESFLLTTSLISSSAKTLHSIKVCCSLGSFSDANTLVRKFRDDLIQFAYILSVINSRNFFLEEIDSPVLTDDEKAIVAWFSNRVSELERPIRRKLEFENYMKFLKRNRDISHIIDEYKLTSYWDTLRKRLNDYVHNNGEGFTRQNLLDENDINLDIHLKNINYRTSYISTFFITILMMIESSLIASSDYMDYLDCNLEPPKDCQFLVAPFIQEFIDKKVSKLHPELKKYLVDNNINGMNIE